LLIIQLPPKVPFRVRGWESNEGSGLLPARKGGREALPVSILYVYGYIMEFLTSNGTLRPAKEGCQDYFLVDKDSFAAKLDGLCSGTI
jgi:hypothetical protein